MRSDPASQCLDLSPTEACLSHFLLHLTSERDHLLKHLRQLGGEVPGFAGIVFQIVEKDLRQPGFSLPLSGIHVGNPSAGQLMA
jgi:hypothetical protein